jgi:hypothetical protein
MRTWKHRIFFAVFLFITGVFYVNAQDMITLKNGDIIKAKVIEISQTEIKYKRFDNIDGQLFVISTANVQSIRNENGTHELNLGIMYGSESQQSQSNKFRFGINANAGGALGYMWGGASGFGINIELGKGKFNSEINLMFPTGGFGTLFTFNGFWPSHIGGFFLGGGIGLSIFNYSWDNSYYDYYTNVYYTNTGTNTVFSIPVGLNIGYKFVTKSGLYFRTGAFAAFDLGYSFGSEPFYFKPDLSIGWTMK